MIMKYLPVLLVLMGCAHSDPWTTQDKWLQVGVTAVLAADAYTTSQIQYHPDVYEAGPARHILGSQPSTRDTYLYFTTLAISSYFISRALPARWRPYYQGSQIGLFGASVFNNAELGLTKKPKKPKSEKP